MKNMKDKNNNVYMIVNWDEFWSNNPDLFLRPLSQKEVEEFAREIW